MLPLSEVVLIIMGLLTVAIVAAGLCRSLPIPFTVVLVTVGMGITWTAQHVPALSPPHAVVVLYSWPIPQPSHATHMVFQLSVESL